MKILLSFFSLCFFLIACSKSNNSNDPSKETGKTSYTAQIKIGNLQYNTSDYSVQSGSVDNYQYNGLNVFGHSAACTAYGFEVQIIDSTHGSLGRLALINFLIPSVSSFSNYNSWLAQLLVNDTVYTGHTIVSANITSNGGQNKVGGDSTVNGSFNLSGIVNNGYSADSLNFSATVSFTNMPY